MLKRVLKTAILLFVILSPVSGQVPGRMERLRATLQEMVDGFPGTMGLAVLDIGSGEMIAFNGERQFPMASVYKIPIMVEVFRQVDAGNLDLDERVLLTENDRTLGSGVLTLLSSGLNPTYHDLVTLMIVLSDNQATDILLKKVGAANVTAAMRSLGLDKIRVDRTTFELIRDYIALMDDRARGKSVQEIRTLALSREVSPETLARAEIEFGKVMKDVSSPLDMARLLEKIYKGEAASRASCEEMMQILGRQMFNQRIPRFIPESVRVVHKTGTIGSTTNDAGILFVRGAPIALVVFTMEKRVGRKEVEDQIGRVSKEVFKFFDYLIK